MTDTDATRLPPAANPLVGDSPPEKRAQPDDRRGFAERLTELSLDRPRLVLALVLSAVVVASFGFVRLGVDTDPENMLPPDDPVRLRNGVLAEEFGAGPMVVVGLFGPVADAADFAAIDRIHDQLAERSDVDAASTISAASTFEQVPETDAAAGELVALIAADPLFGGNVLFDRVAADGSEGAAIFVALLDKGAAGDVADAARRLIAGEPALVEFDVEVAGQPLAEDAFGQQMFVQMAVFAPLAGLLVFAILFAFFRRLQLVVPAMLVAIATVVITMGALVGTGNTLHIMSSMIPIFLMPIAILDAVHVLSEFFDRTDSNDRRRTLGFIFGDLRRPIGFTSLTTAVGFAALALVPIPPVRVFGIFVAIGVGLAWLFTMSLLPAYLMTTTSKPTAPHKAAAPTDRASRMQMLGRRISRSPRPILTGVILAAAAVAPGLAALQVNDNPVRWFRADHDVREATDRMATALPGIFSASLLLTEEQPGRLDEPATRAAVATLADELRTHPDVGAVQTYVDAPYRMLRSESRANVRVQLREGDNVTMQSVVDLADDHLAEQPIPGVEIAWAGEAFLNLTWQQKMVSGMMIGFATTLVAIFGLLIALFRSFRWGLLAMVPVLWTVLVVYGVLGLAGRDIDMPLAVLSTMVLGIGVDFAIHFVARFRALRDDLGSTEAATAAFYGEPARALTRNAAVIAIGFSPLVLSSLVPYIVVGALLASIVILSWLATIIVLPAAVNWRLSTTTGR